MFRYEVRRWRDGVVPDLSFAVASPVRITNELSVAQRIFDALLAVPTPVWGLDELDAGEMWTCNSVISWTLASVGIDVERFTLPPHARAPGWHAGLAVANRPSTARRRAGLHERFHDGLRLRHPRRTRRVGSDARTRPTSSSWAPTSSPPSSNASARKV
jgi:hypothetical protein